jgi:hypothetical protein
MASVLNCWDSLASDSFEEDANNGVQVCAWQKGNFRMGYELAATRSYDNFRRLRLQVRVPWSLVTRTCGDVETMESLENRGEDDPMLPRNI